MSRNIFNNETETSIGERLLNIQSLNIAQDQVAVLGLNNVVEGVNISSYGKTLLNQTSISSLRNSILEADTSIEITDTSIGEINLNVDNNLKLQILADKSIFHNDILVDNIKRKSDDTPAISFGSTTTTLQKAMTIFRDSTSNDKGYVRVQNSTTNKSGYIDFMTGENDRVAYLGQGEENDLLKTGNFLYLGMENQCGFSINDGVVSIFNVNLENDSINLNYTTNANNNFIMKNDNAHKEINNNNNLPLLKVATGQLYSANLYGKDANNGLILSSTPLHYKLDAKVGGADKDVYIPKSQCDTLTANTSAIIPTINLTRVRFTGETSDAILFSSNQTRYFKPIYIDWNNGNGKKFTIQGGNCDYSLYTSGTNGGSINIAHNISYDPPTETESVTTNSLYTSKIIVSNEGIKFRQSASVNTLPITDIATFSNTSCDFNNDINLAGISKIHFSSNNYIQNDANHNLKIYINNNKNFVANTGNDQSSYEFKIDDNSVLKMTRDLTSNPVLPNNKVQVSSQKLVVKDDAVVGGYVELERTGASGILSGYINYYNTTGRLFYTGFNEGGISGNPLHYFEGQCRSYTFKNELSSIMKIVSYDNTISATSNYVHIQNRLECPNLQMYNSSYVDGTQPNNDDTLDELNARNFSTSDTGHLRLSSGGGTNPSTAKTLIDIFGSATEANRLIRFKVGDQPMLKITSNEIRCGNAIVPDGGVLNVGNINNRWGNVYTTNLNSNTGLFNTNLQTPSLISSTNTSSNQCRLDLDDLLGSFVFRDGAGTEKSVLIASYNALVCNSQITANQGILMNNTFYSKHIIPTPDDATYDIGSLNFRYRDIYASNGNIETSDRNLKKDIQPIQGGLQTIMNLKPVSYKFKDGQSGRTHTGFISQDCKDLYIKDWAGYIENNNKYGLRYTEFISLNTKAIQELYKIVENKTSTNYQQGGNRGSPPEEHKCNNYELITQLNSYEVQLLQNEEKLNKMDKFLEEVIEDKEKIEIEMKTHKTQNSILEKRVIDLENKLQIIENKHEDIDESDGGINMIEMLQSRNHDLELKTTKLEAKLKKLTSIVNKLVKSSN